MKKRHVKAIVWVLVLGFPALVLAQRMVKPEELKVSPAKYRNSSIRLQDIFIDIRAGVPPALTAAGYKLDRYITFGLQKAGMRCFIRRNSQNEKLVMGLKRGDRITVSGIVKQPKAKVKIALYQDGKRLTGRPYQPAELSPVEPNVYMYGSQLPMGIFNKGGNYTLKVTLKDEISGTERVTELPLVLPEKKK
jgi:hypothetical protein